MGNTVIKSLKYPNVIHYEWTGELIEKNEDYIIVLCRPGRILRHYTKKKELVLDNWSLEFFSLNKCFTVAMEISKGEVLSYYCNVSTPSAYKDGEISFIDLDLDYVKPHNNEWRVVDEDEFLENSSKYGYSIDLINSAVNSLEFLKEMVKNKEFPFNDDIKNYI